MSKTAEKLSARLRKEKEKTLAFFNSLPDEVWSQKLYSDGARWSVYQVLVHIVDSEENLSRLFAHIAAGGKGVGEDFDIDAYNKQAVESLEGAEVEALLAQFSSKRDALIEMVRGLDEEKIQSTGRHPFLGEASLEEMLRLFYLHVNLHIRDVRKISKG